MEKSLTFADNDSFYTQLLEMESRNEVYVVDTEISEAKNLPLRLLHHVGISKDDIAHVQHKVVEENALMHDFIEPMLVKFNEMTGKFKPARGYEFTVQADDYDTIKIHGRPKVAEAAAA
ncbi:MAG TPA: hypothetical protein PLD20_11600 [Blastocatellia bacterium]|nr:hypothetical protein [Blastocatellia bacterium]HMV83394.1 hypothetical protein [Blastocatellia bacterium]HMX27228.1 hypothetical protein [Blastocatellia bacterium]HMY70370.1 hypothetical protein [Blastocatellia bacterium]HMZ18568.1 hypothetical protein [Blastocatellia bacterium]